VQHSKVSALRVRLRRQFAELCAAADDSGPGHGDWGFDDAPLAAMRVRLDGEEAGRLVQANHALSTLSGYTTSELLRMRAADFDQPRDRTTTGEVLERLRTSPPRTSERWEKRCRRRDGSWVWVRATAARIRDEGVGNPPQAIIFVEDITLQRREQAQLAHQALHDPLTGLANRTLLAEDLRRGLRQLPRHDETLALFYVDLDHFKVVNDEFGHEVGDRILTEVARRLSLAVRAGDTVARIGGDEFAVLCPRVAGDFEAVQIADRMLSMVRAPIGLPTGRELVITPSVGIVLTSSATTEPAELHRSADQAMYRAKSDGRDGWAIDAHALSGTT